MYASYYQFYIQDSEPRCTADDPTFWTDEADADRLAIGDGMLAIGTGSYDFVKIRVENRCCEPSLDLSQWDHVTECGLDVKTKLILITGCISQSGLFFGVEPGHYRVRVCHANLAESEREVEADWTGEFRDHYRVQFWPAPPSESRVLKRL